MSTRAFKVVIIDDESDALRLLKEMLQKVQRDVVCFHNPEPCLTFIAQNYRQISMVISDYKMKPVDGFAFKRQINALAKHTRDIPFVIVTGFFDKTMMKEGLSVGIKSFLEKPIQEKDLTQTLINLSEEREELLKDELEMIEGFLEESDPILEQIESLILSLEADPHDVELLNTYFRLLHTIKGTAACIGLEQLAKFAHSYEDFIDHIRKEKKVVNSSVTTALLSGYDTLKQFHSLVKTSYSDHYDGLEEKIRLFEEFDFSTHQSIPSTSYNEKQSQEDFLSQNLEIKNKDKVDEKMSVSLELLDYFMEMSGELTVTRNSIVKTARGLEERYKGDECIERLNDLLSEMHKITSSMQQQIYELRKVPLKSVFRPFKRLVRDISKNLDKKVELVLKGEDLLVDTSISRLLSNSLIHLLRNSLDHGIESVKDRQQNGKPEVGKIELLGSVNGENIIIKIIDDGKGINTEEIKKIAFNKELYSEEDLARMAEQEIYALIFESGFSTSKEVSDLSGRGVGMDMVRSSIEDAGGRIAVDSNLGKGSCFELVIPIPKSVMIINSLVVIASDQTFVLPVDNVSQIVEVDTECETNAVLKVEQGAILEHNGILYPLVSLCEILGFSKNKQSSQRSFVILKTKKAPYALEVDKVDDFEEVVLKKLSFQDNANDLYQGAALLGTGSISLVLNSETLAQRAQLKARGGNKAVVKPSEKAPADKEAMRAYMLFDLADKDHFCIDLDFVFRLETFSFEEITHSGARQVLRYRDRTLCLIDVVKEIGLSSNKVHAVKPGERFTVIVVDQDDQFFGFIVSELKDIGYSREALDRSLATSFGVAGCVYINGKTYTALSISQLIVNHHKLKGTSQAA